MKKRLTLTLGVCLSYFLLGMLFVSCASRIESTPIRTPTLQATITETHSPTNTLVPTLTSPPTQTSTPIPTNTPTRTPSPEPIEVVKVMQYNINFGGGFSQQCAQIRSSDMDGINSIVQITEIITTVNPDVLLINENCGFGNPGVVKNIVARIGMINIFIGKDHFVEYLSSEGHQGTTNGSAIFTKDGFDIVESKTLFVPNDLTSELVDEMFNGIHAVVQTPGGKSLNFYVVHLTPYCGGDADTNCSAKELQVEWIKNYIGDTPNAILTGDFNFRRSSDWSYLLTSEGWKIQPQRTIHRWTEIPHYDASTGAPSIVDHAFIHEDSNLKFIPFSDEELKDLELLAPTFQLASDHEPNYFQIGIYPSIP